MKQQPGFTLIETIIYLALFAMIIGGGMLAAYQIIQDTDATQNHIVLQEEANFLFRKMDWALTGATAATTTASSLVVSKPIFGTSTQLTFTLTGGNITLQRNSNPAVILNSSDIPVSMVSFMKNQGTNGAPPSITINFSLTTAQNGQPASQSFSFTKYLNQ